MKYKILILGPQCSGKTTLVRYLRERVNGLPLVEEDELFTKLNGGTYPSDLQYKEDILRPELQEEIIKSDNIIFVTSYCKPEMVRELKQKGFIIAQLILDREKLEERNERRTREEGYDDAREWFEENLKFHQEIRNEGLVDHIIDANKPVEVIAKEILNFSPLL
jgi:shikimate kinase